ncbi:MAG TPA: amidohydrolase family protein [Terriglobales bacterium]|nr:amidohydrolase family protein [Terriglobales bacterium]
MKLVVPLMILFAMNLQAQSSKLEAPDQIFINGDIYTGAEEGFGGAAAKVYPRAQAIAAKKGRIVEVGTSDALRKRKGPRTQVIDLGGHFVMPGLNDAHLHLANGGFEMLNVELSEVKSLEEMKARIAERVKSAGPGEWILGRGWDDTKWTAQKIPTRQDLDSVTGDHPALFIRTDGHMLVANTAALRIAGITKQTQDPEGGRIDRDNTGEPEGGLRETAQVLARKMVPPPTPAQRRRGAELALQQAARYGLTSAQDNSQWEDFLTYADLENEGKLTLRISEWLPFPQPLNILEQHRVFHSPADPMLHTGMLKAFMDGSIGSHTAAMLSPYTDEPKNSGLPQYEQATLDQMSAQRAAAGFQMGFHAIGDRGVAMALQAFAAAERYVEEKNPNAPQLQQPGGFRFRMEHAQVVEPEDFARFRQLRVIASMQPNHLLTDMNWAIQRIGTERAKHSYAWNEFLRNGVVLAFGTDYPVEPITPFRGLYAAVTRKNEAGTKEYVPEQKISIDQAIAAYTTGAAYAEFAESEKGRLAPGFLADFVVLDRDISKVAPAEILQTKVLRTVVGGKTVYEAAK